MPNTLILIPSRLGAKRLPGKPLLKINGLSIISHVYNKALETNIGDAYVATSDQEIHENVIQNGGKSILTSKEHPTGTDRIFEAYKKLNISNIDYILNLQGDEPLIEPNDIKNLINKVTSFGFDMGTLAANIESDYKLNDENIVKVKTEDELNDNKLSRAIDFFRKVKNIKIKYIYHHIGIYLYKVNILEKIVSLKQTTNEKKLKLEQLRALENNIEIYTTLAQSLPIGIDTEEDYKKVKNLLETKN